MYRLVIIYCISICTFFFFNDTATTEIYTLSLHDALPISIGKGSRRSASSFFEPTETNGNGPYYPCRARHRTIDRKSTRLNSSHLVISYAVFCLKKKKELIHTIATFTPHGLT